ncbi:MAG: hypothetical protein WB767_17385 [Nocardioides sp.]
MTTSPLSADNTGNDFDTTELEQRREQRTALKTRHSQSLTKLMEERSDLRGVHALADFVDDFVRWTA